MYAHDVRLTGFQAGPSHLTPTTVPTLGLKWAVALHEAVWASPIVAAGRVYVATSAGNVLALDASDGRVRWRRRIGNMVRMTPMLADGRLLVGVYGFNGTPHAAPYGASLQALDPASGRVLWRTPLPGVVRSEPVAISGIVYEGIAGGDPASGCTNGRIVTLDERTGRLLPRTWFTSGRPRDGGGIWSPLSYDGSTIYFGTGNTCSGSGAQNAMVAVTPSLRTRWIAPARTPAGDDEDVGSGALIAGDRLYFVGKTGLLYALDRRSGRELWTADTHPDARGDGGFATPAGDGSIVVVNSGGGSQRSGATELEAFDTAGHERYALTQHKRSTPSLGASFVPGVGFAGIDRTLVAFAAGTGKQLWSYATADGFYAVPAIASDDVFAVDLSGNVYAFALGAHGTAANLVSPPDSAPAISPRRRMLLVALGLAGAIVVGAGVWIGMRLARAPRPGR